MTDDDSTPTGVGQASHQSFPPITTVGASAAADVAQVIEESISSSPESAPTEDSSAEQAPHEALKARLLAQFEKWVDDMLAEEAPPRGVPESILADAIAMAAEAQPPPEADLYALFSGLTGLAGEIGLQGRTFKQLADLISPLAQTPALLAQLREAQLESTEAIQAALENQAHDDQDAEPVPFKQVCEVMIDLYDRLHRGLQTCDEGIRSLEARPSGAIGRIFGAAKATDTALVSVRALREAGAMTLARLAAALQEWGIERIGKIGDQFDPERMTAIEVRPVPAEAPDTVLVVNRSGYAFNGVLKSTAQVTVSKA